MHAIPNVRAHLDLNREAFGMTLRSPQVPNGVPVDGQPDAIPPGTPTWWTVSGPQGGVAFSATYDQNVTSAPVVWNEDDTTPVDAQCTGDTEAVGDTGAFFNQFINCTDPGTGCTGHLRGTYRIVAAASSTTPAELQRLAEHFQRPLRVTVNGRGTGPSPGECVTAANSAHVTAGRATAFFFRVWAVGSGEYIGTTADTTSLRRSGSSWSRVASC